MASLADLRPAVAPAAGRRIVIDLRPLQEPERSPITSAYLRLLLGGFAASPVPDEDIVAVLRILRPDPLAELEAAGLHVAGRRWLPPTSRAFGAAAGMIVDRPLLRGASVRADDRDAAEGRGAVFHTAGGAMPIRSALPVVATLLDLAPWELPERYARSAVARFGHRQRAAMLRAAARVIVCSRATADAAARLLALDEEQVDVVPLAADDAFLPGPPDAARLARLRDALRLPPRYLVVGGRWDARSDLVSVLGAIAALRDAVAPAAAGDGRGTGSARATGDATVEEGWPPVLVLAGAAGHDPAGPSRVAALVERLGVTDLVRLTPPLDIDDRAALTAGAVAHIQPALSDSTGIAALDALAAGVPVIASRAGALPEIVGPAGIVVEPRDPLRMATALRAIWSGGPVAQQVRRAAQHRAAGARRRWSDVAAETRAAYAAAGSRGGATVADREPGTR